MRVKTGIADKNRKITLLLQSAGHKDNVKVVATITTTTTQTTTNKYNGYSNCKQEEIVHKNECR